MPPTICTPRETRLHPAGQWPPVTPIHLQDVFNPKILGPPSGNTGSELGTYIICRTTPRTPPPHPRIGRYLGKLCNLFLLLICYFSHTAERTTKSMQHILQQFFAERTCLRTYACRSFSLHRIFNLHSRRRCATIRFLINSKTYIQGASAPSFLRARFAVYNDVAQLRNFMLGIFVIALLFSMFREKIVLDNALCLWYNPQVRNKKSLVSRVVKRF